MTKPIIILKLKSDLLLIPVLGSFLGSSPAINEILFILV
jgi:hypothetical protein